MVVGVFVMA